MHVSTLGRGAREPLIGRICQCKNYPFHRIKMQEANSYHFYHTLETRKCINDQLKESIKHFVQF